MHDTASLVKEHGQGAPAPGSRVPAAAAQPIRGGTAPTAAPTQVLAADTTVVLDDVIYGKPRDREDGLGMLRRLSGRKHEVLTAVALAGSRGVAVRLSVSAVTFRGISPEECAAYWDTGEPRDKAGGYAIQGAAAVFIESLSGSYSGVMGLPLFETAGLLQAAGVPYWEKR